MCQLSACPFLTSALLWYVQHPMCLAREFDLAKTWNKVWPLPIVSSMQSLYSYRMQLCTTAQESPQPGTYQQLVLVYKTQDQHLTLLHI
jgi:hypothetical protein